MCDCKQCRTVEREREYYSAVLLSLTNEPPPLRDLQVIRVDAPLTSAEGHKAATSRDPMQLRIASI